MLNGLQATAELGWISDRNFLEQYYEYEWDNLKDQSTGVELKQILGSGAWSLTTDLRLNDFFTQTEWLPRFDHYQIGMPLFGSRLTWYEHTNVGYARLRTATTPEDSIDAAKFNQLGWETSRDALRVATRQEIELPFQLGPAKIVPFALGELAHWGNDINGDDVTRAFGQAGVRSSVPLWTVNPSVQSELFDLNGLAHKVSLDSEFFWADANRNLDRLPLYDPLDDDSIEHFRRRFIDDTFGGMAFIDEDVPLRFDERYFALRSGLQGQVTSPSTEIADDLMVVRLGTRHRWQTKRGPIGQERIADWIVLGVQGTLFPKAGRDNFGEDLGLMSYDFRWHLGDRVTLVSEGFADVFSQGLKTVSIGGFLTRPAYSSLYVGLRSIEGPISTNILETAFQYRLSSKWISRSSSTIDFGKVGNIGQSYEIIRVGESFLVGLG